MVPIGKDKEDVDTNKRPTPYSLPSKPIWKSLFNSSQISQPKLSTLRASELKASNKPPPLKNISPITPESPSTSAKTFPVPMPRKTSSSESTPVPLPRTIFNLPPIDSTSVLIGRSTSLPTDRKEAQVRPRLAHSVSEPSNRPVKIDDPAPALPESPDTPLEDLDEEEDGDTWL
ncbi:hypothetical protein GHT06_013839 [Daphnia sinensis]|uniref:Uncharacterized protein n=1 Tax=Daphnia sinensis TaxID=1820382 RepID=A0AAD5PUK0_9CRUS|nr:hypothetical protein GHT06_013839 [Daphnia sinensis]